MSESDTVFRFFAETKTKPTVTGLRDFAFRRRVAAAAIGEWTNSSMMGVVIH